MSAAPLTSMTVSEYLAWEPSQTFRHEYIRGQVVAMTGGTLPSLQYYVLVSSTQMVVEVYRRGEGRMWLYYPYQKGDTIHLESLGLACAVEQIYEDVIL